MLVVVSVLVRGYPNDADHRIDLRDLLVMAENWLVEEFWP